MSSNNIRVLFLYISVLAVLIGYNEASPASEDLRSKLEHVVLDNFDQELKILLKHIHSSSIPDVIASLSKLGLKGPSEGGDEPADTSSPSNLPSNIGSLIKDLPAAQVGSLIAAVPSAELGPNIKNLPSDELRKVLREIPHIGVQQTLGSVPSGTLREILGQLPSDELNKILESEPSLGGIPDDKLAEVAARLGSGLIILAKMFPPTIDGHLLAHLPTSDAGNFVKDLTPDDIKKFAAAIPKDKLTSIVNNAALADRDATSVVSSADSVVSSADSVVSSADSVVSSADPVVSSADSAANGVASVVSNADSAANYAVSVVNNAGSAVIIDEDIPNTDIHLRFKVRYYR